MCLRCDTNIALCAKGSAEMREIMKRNHTKILSVILTAALIGSLIASPTTAGAAKKLKAVSPKSVTAGKSIKVKVNMKCKFKSSNKKIATVNSKGVVKGKKVGKVKITVTAKKSKQKKILKIAVRKSCINRKTPTPKVNETQSPQTNVTQPPQSTVTQTPNVTATPPTTSKPSTPKPDVPATPPATQTADPIGTKTPLPDVPSTPKPSVSPAPTSTASPSTRKPIGITAEFEGKIPINRTLSYEAISMATIFEYNIVVKLEYDDNSYEVIPKQKIDIDGSKDKSIVEEGEKKYIDTKVTFEKFTTILRVELVDVPENVIYPDELMCSYTGGKIKENGFPDKKDIQVQAVNIDGTAPYINSNEISMLLTYDDIEEKKYEFWIQYDYYFDYNGEKMHTTSGAYIWVPYE